MKFLVFMLGFLLSVFMTGLLAAPIKNGFDLTNTSIPSYKILSGGPDRDGIPAIDNPIFLESDKVDFLQPDDRVLGLTYQGRSKAYPIKILNYHEIVNDQFASEPVVVTFCPLCGSGIAYSAKVAGQKHHFGVSGLLYNSDVLLYDRETESLWSQLMNQAISGPMQGKHLKTIALNHTTWLDWKKRFPDTLVLSQETGYYRDYSRNPYEKYKLNKKVWFPIEKYSNRYHPKEMVLGLELNGHFKAYPFSEISKMTDKINDQLADRNFTIYYDKQHQTARAIGINGEEIPSVITFWFAWYAFHPETLIYQVQ